MSKTEELLKMLDAIQTGPSNYNNQLLTPVKWILTNSELAESFAGFLQEIQPAVLSGEPVCLEITQETLSQLVTIGDLAVLGALVSDENKDLI